MSTPSVYSAGLISNEKRENTAMGDCVHFGIVPDIDRNKDYSINGSGDFKALLTKYHCVSVPDDFVNEWIPSADNIPTYFCSLGRKHIGIDHYGVTLIPPESVKMLYDIVCPYADAARDESVRKLAGLLGAALDKRQYVICYGI